MNHFTQRNVNFLMLDANAFFSQYLRKKDVIIDSFKDLT